LELARIPASARGERAIELARSITGARAARLFAGGRLVAAAGPPLEGGIEAHHADLSLRLAPPLDGAAGERERLVARAILAAIDEHHPAAPDLVAPSRIRSMVDRVLAAGLDLARLESIATDLAVEATGAARGFLLLREPGERLGYRT